MFSTVDPRFMVEISVTKNILAKEKHDLFNINLTVHGGFINKDQKKIETMCIFMNSGEEICLYLWKQPVGVEDPLDFQQNIFLWGENRTQSN